MEEGEKILKMPDSWVVEVYNLALSYLLPA